MKKYLFAFIPIIVLMVPVSSSAGVCIDLCEFSKHPRACAKQKLRESAAAFRGKVMNIEEIDKMGRFRATFKVEHSWKGVSARMIQVYFYAGGGVEDPVLLTMGATYSFFAYTAKDALQIDACSSAEGNEKYLGEGRSWDRLSAK